MSNATPASEQETWDRETEHRIPGRGNMGNLGVEEENRASHVRKKRIGRSGQEGRSETVDIHSVSQIEECPFHREKWEGAARELVQRDGERTHSS